MEVRIPPDEVFTRIGYDPHKGQSEFHTHIERFKAALWGRRGGKTTAAVGEVWEGAVQEDDFAGPPFIYIIADTYAHASKVFWGFVESCNRDPELRTLLPPKNVKRSPFPHLELAPSKMNSGAKVYCKSAENPQSLTGDGVTKAVIDESQFVSDEGWNNFRPALMDRHGHVAAYGVAQGRNWFYDMWQRGQDDVEANYWSKSYSSEINPYLDPEELREITKDITERMYRQLIKAEWQDSSGATFMNIYENVKADTPGHSGYYVIGCDLADKRDWTVCMVLDALSGHFVDMLRIHHEGYTSQELKIADLAQRWKNSPVWLDVTNNPAVGAHLRDEYSVDVRDFQIKEHSKALIIQKLQLAMERQTVSYSNDPIITNELDIFHFEEQKNGSFKWGAPRGRHDDIVIAMALAVHGRDKSMPQAKPVKIAMPRPLVAPYRRPHAMPMPSMSRLATYRRRRG